MHATFKGFCASLEANILVRFRLETHFLNNDLCSNIESAKVTLQASKLKFYNLTVLFLSKKSTTKSKCQQKKNFRKAQIVNK